MPDPKAADTTTLPHSINEPPGSDVVPPETTETPDPPGPHPEPIKAAGPKPKPPKDDDDDDDHHPKHKGKK